MSRLKKLTTAAVLATTLMTSGCLGANHAFEGIRDWNRTATGNKWGNEAIFLGLSIVPVYAFAYLGDVLVFNTMEFWTGHNPIAEPASRREADYHPDDAPSAE